MINSRLVNLSLFFFTISLIIFVFFPNFDLEITKLFFSLNGGDFKLRYNSFVYFFYWIIPIFTKVFIGFLILSFFYLILKYRNFSKLITSSVFYLLMTVLIGPGLIVNAFFKEYSGRARPSQITEFNGSKKFTPVLEITDQCSHNCSFSSGHAAMGYYFTTFAYISRHKYFSKIYILAIIFGTFVGISRIMMGGHFTSDVISSAFVVLFINQIIYLLWKKKIFLPLKSQ